MYFVSKKLKKKHNIADERAALYGAAEEWVDALKGRRFLGMLISFIICCEKAHAYCYLNLQVNMFTYF